MKKIVKNKKSMKILKEEKTWRKGGKLGCGNYNEEENDTKVHK